MKVKGIVVKILVGMIAGMLVFTSAGCAKSTGDANSTQQTSSAKTAGGAETTSGREMIGNMYKTGLPIVKDKVTFNFMGLQMNNTRPNNLDETDMMLKIAEETNIEIVWDLIPQASWMEKKNLIVASRELPDAFFGPRSLSADEAQKFGSDGVIITLDDLLKEYAPNILAIMNEYPIYESFLRSMDGKLYFLGSLTDQGFDSLISTIINKSWLDQLGL